MFPSCLDKIFNVGKKLFGIFYIGRIGQKNAGAVQLQALRIPHFPVHNVMIVFFSEIYICPYIALCVVEASDKTVVF